MRSLVRGVFGSWIRDREHGNPRAVYENAIQERMSQYAQLKQAVAGILYMRSKLEAEIRGRRSEISRVKQDIDHAVKRGDDDVALAMISHRNSLQEDLERSQGELDSVRQEVDAARKNLVTFRGEIQALEREKVRMLATLASSSARRRIQDALQGLSVEGDMRALESVREHIGRLEAEGRVEVEVEDGGLQKRVKQIRAEARLEGVRRELEEMKRSLQPEKLIAGESEEGRVLTGKGRVLVVSPS
ncbi:MAG: PspA/IM30 family protein [Myxococcota bacterium]